jgi:hypothetical protein
MNAHRITTTAGTLLATATLAAAPAAAAEPTTRDLRSPDARDAAAVAMAQSPSQDLRSPDTRDAANPVRPVVVQIPATPLDAGFEWDSAAIGALAGAGLMISIVGGSVLITRRRPRARAARPA